MWMHERFFCTVYEAVKAMLPAGLWFKGGKQRVHEKYVTMAELDVPAEEAMDAAQRKRLRAPMQADCLLYTSTSFDASSGRNKQIYRRCIECTKGIALHS